MSPFLLCSHRISPRVPALPAQEAQTLPGWFKIKPYAVSKTNEEAVRAKAGTGLKPPKPEPLVSPADLISPSARAPRARQPGEATGGPGEEVNWCDRSRDGWPSLEEKPREGRGCLRWDIGMVGEGCWTVPAYQDPSFLQTRRQDPERALWHWHHPHPSRREIPFCVGSRTPSSSKPS